MVFEKIENENISSRIINQFLDAIAKKKLKPGDKIPTESKLADLFNVSRGIVRESIKSLENIGVLEVKTRKGIYIKKFDFNLFVKKFLPFLFLDQSSDIIDLLHVREALEIYGTRLAVKKVTEKDLEILKRILKNLEENAKNLNTEEYLENDIRYHFEICKISGNLLLPKLIKMLRMYYLEQQEKVLRIPGKIQEGINQHKKIYKAIENRDENIVESLIVEHLKDIERAITED